MTGYGWPTGAVGGGSAAAAERECASILNRVVSTTSRGCVAFHDVVVPNPRGYTYNIDHVLVSGTDVLLVDDKAWKSGFVWTVNGSTSRDEDDFSAADSGGVEAALADLSAYLAPLGARFVKPLVVVWPVPRTAEVSTWAARVRCGRIVDSKDIESEAAAFCQRPADAAIVEALRPHLAR